MYRNDIDAYKGIAIIAVVLFHLGYLKSGYLGVDLFFVINGFLVIPSILKKMEASEFSLIDFMKRRMSRLYPLVVLATSLCLAIGYFCMLPDNYENLCQAIVASNFMSENILSSITTHDYWNTVNDYNPLMHLWYVGILFEFYLCFPLILIAAQKLFKKYDMVRVNYHTLIIITLLSFFWYVLPAGGDKFYHLPSRLFEITSGGILALVLQRKTAKCHRLMGEAVREPLT